MKELRAIGLITTKNVPYSKWTHMFKVVTKVVGPINNSFSTVCSQLKVEFVPELIKLLTRKGYKVSYINNEGGLANV